MTMTVEPDEREALHPLLKPLVREAYLQYTLSLRPYQRTRVELGLELSHGQGVQRRHLRLAVRARGLSLGTLECAVAPTYVGYPPPQCFLKSFNPI